MVPDCISRRLEQIKRRIVLKLAPETGDPFLRFARPGHFYSPVPDLAFILNNREKLFDRSVANVAGIDINASLQLRQIDEFSNYYQELPFTEQPGAGQRYYYENPYFSYGDAIILHMMMRHLRPHNVIEVGSGFSSAVMLDTNDLFLQGTVQFTFIEPHPERLLSLLTDGDKQRTRVIRDVVQHVPPEHFSRLKAKDILFIDSSHVAKTGSDVVYLFSEVLPALQDGVIIHFHDVFWPFEYPEEWIRAGRGWNESYVLRAFLQYNRRFRILLFNSYLGTHHTEYVGRRLPLFLRNTGGSLWIQKVPSAPRPC